MVIRFESKLLGEVEFFIRLQFDKDIGCLAKIYGTDVDDEVFICFCKIEFTNFWFFDSFVVIFHDKLNIDGSCGQDIADGIDKNCSNKGGVWNESVHASV